MKAARPACARLACKGPEALVSGVRSAKGSGGRCYKYVEEIYTLLAKVGIDDPAATQLWRTVLSHIQDGSFAMAL